jgi:hypothetical protein
MLLGIRQDSPFEGAGDHYTDAPAMGGRLVERHAFGPGEGQTPDSRPEIE